MSIVELVSEKLRRFQNLRTAIKRVYQKINFLINYLLGRFIRIKTESKYYLLPKGSFFGYYDKSPWNNDLSMVLFHLLEKDSKSAKICLYNIKSKKYHSIGATNSFSLQQGAMLQWYNQNTIIYNIYEEKIYKSIVVDTDGNRIQTFSKPIYCIDKNRENALTLNFNRLQKCAEPYAYFCEKYKENNDLESDGIWEINLQENSEKLIITLKDLENYETLDSMDDAFHYINHIEYSKKDNIFVFFHRWQNHGVEHTRLFSYNKLSKNLMLIGDCEMISHYTWLNNNNLIAWARINGINGYYEFSTDKKYIQPFLLDVFTSDGHPTLSKDEEWLITDSYPDKKRVQSIYAYNLNQAKKYTIAELYHPFKFEAITRCDLHPRLSNNNMNIIVDTVFTGERQMAVFNIANIIKIK